MERELYKKLVIWKNKKDRKPLLLQGARQVGKTYLLKEFGKREYNDIIYLNFEEDPGLSSLFKNNLSTDILIETLSTYIGKKILQKSMLIFFDEIQVCSRAITSLKYFCESSEDYHVVSAGSLLGVSIGKDVSFPVGKVNFMNLYPLSFKEYLSVTENMSLVSFLENKKDLETVPSPIHDKLMMLLKYYLYIGGMPEVVYSYIKDKNILKVREIQKEILLSYENDFSKYNTKTDALKTKKVWETIPYILAKENKKFKYSDVKKDASASRYSTALEWLKNAGLIYVANLLKVPKLPLKAYYDDSKFKVFVLDIGILCCALDTDSKTILEGDKLFLEYYGAIIENYVANTFYTDLKKDICYWKSKGEAEVDFILNLEEKIIPIEVKSGISRRTKGLRIFAEKYDSKKVFRISARNFTQDNDFINIPLYAAAFMSTFCSWKNP